MEQPIEELESLRQLRISDQERRDSAKTFDQGTHKKDGTTLNPTQCSATSSSILDDVLLRSAHAF